MFCYQEIDIFDLTYIARVHAVEDVSKEALPRNCGGNGVGFAERHNPQEWQV